MAPPVVLCINPWITDFAAHDHWAAPLGLLTIASTLKMLGARVHFVDLLGTRRKHKKASGSGRYVKQAIPLPEPLHPAGIDRIYFRYGMSIEEAWGALHAACSSPPDIVLITSHMTYWYPGVADAIRLVKEVFSGVPIVLGGIYATICPDHAAKQGADLVLSGPFDEAALSRITTTFGLDLAPDPAALDAFVFAPDPVFLTGRRFAPLLLSRGCPRSCPYCASKRLFGRPVAAPPEPALAYLVRCRDDLGIANAAFYDDALLSLGLPALRSLADANLGMSFHSPNGLEIARITDDTAAVMRRAGFATIRLGLETTSSRAGLDLGGKASLDQFSAATGSLLAAGFPRESIGVYLMAGLPGQSVADVAESIDLVHAAGFRTWLNLYSPVPGTPLFDREASQSLKPIDEPLWHDNSLLPYRSPVFDREATHLLVLRCRGQPS